MKFNTIKALLGLLLLVALFASLSSAAKGQVQINGQEYLPIPIRLQSFVKASMIDSIHGRMLEVEELQRKGDKAWKVYSDKSRNALKDNPNGLSNGDFLDFMEPVYVEAVKGNWLKVRTPFPDGKEGSEQNKFRGWINADNLILSDYALLNSKGSPRKALVLVSLADLKPGDVEKYNIGQNHFYNQPEATIANRNGKTAKKWSIYFILKETAGSVLLSSVDKLSGSEKGLQTTVHGWMPKSDITSWDHRLCLEPSNTFDALEAYKGEKNKIPVFVGLRSLKTSQTMPVPLKDSIITTYYVQPNRLIANTPRMPILDHVESNIKKVAVVGSLGADEDSPEERARICAQAQKLKGVLGNVNILFVVDATKSMASYYTAISQSIREIIRSNEIKGINANLKFGLVVYRDYADGESGMYNIWPLTASHDKIIDAALNVKCASVDTDLPEAQYQGLSRGIKEAGFIKDHSNIVVLIGDAGNHRPDPKGKTHDEVVKLMSDYKVSMIAFQVISGADQSYLNFNRDAREYLRNTAKLECGDPAMVKLKEVSIPNTSELRFNYADGKEGDLLMFGRFTYASEGQPMSADLLKRNVIESVVQYLGNVDTKRNLLEAVCNGGESSSGQLFSEEFKHFLRKRGFSVEEIEILMRQGDVSTTGYTETVMKGKDVPCLEPVVFMSRSEKMMIDNILNRLIGGRGTSTEKKGYFKDALITQCKAMTGGENMSDEVIKNLTLSEVWNIILGIPYPGSVKIKNMPLRELDKMSDVDFDNFYIPFEKQAQAFTRNAFKESRFSLGGQEFYWIPMDQMPGSGE